MRRQEAAPLLAQDPSIWCVSSWNDNGQAALDWDPQRLVCTFHLGALACPHNITPLFARKEHVLSLMP